MQRHNCDTSHLIVAILWLFFSRIIPEDDKYLIFLESGSNISTSGPPLLHQIISEHIHRLKLLQPLRSGRSSLKRIIVILKSVIKSSNGSRTKTAQWIAYVTYAKQIKEVHQSAPNSEVQCSECSAVYRTY